jgi:hypothetical protein
MKRNTIEQDFSVATNTGVLLHHGGHYRHAARRWLVWSSTNRGVNS